MKLLPPDKIPGEILHLIKESKEFIIFVTPHVKISQKFQVVQLLEMLRKRNVKFLFFIDDADDNGETIEELANFYLPFIAIPNLNARIYLNDQAGIVSSMDLFLNADKESLSIAYQTQTQQEYKELKEYLRLHFKIDFDELIFSKDEFYFTSYVVEKIYKKTGINAYFSVYDNDILNFNTDDNIYFFDYHDSKGSYCMTAMLMQKKYKYEKLKLEEINIESLELSFLATTHEHGILIEGIYKEVFNEKNWHNLPKTEQKKLADKFIEFILFFEKF